MPHQAASTDGPDPCLLTLADWSDLQDERCRHVSRGKHELFVEMNGWNATGKVVCANWGCPVNAIHPEFVHRYRRAAAATAQRVPTVRPAPASSVTVWPLLVALAVLACALALVL